MSTYRDNPRPPKPIVIILRRTLASIWFTLTTLTIVTPFMLAFFSTSTLDCSRSAGTCRITIRVGPGIVTHVKTIPLRSIERATVEKHVDGDGDTLEGIALVIDGQPDTFDGNSNIGHDGKVQWVDTVNAFLRDPGREHLEIQHGTIWPNYAWALFIVAAITVVLRARTAFTVDKANGRLTVENRGIVTKTQLFNLAEIAYVTVDEKLSDSETVRAVVVGFKDGSSKAVTDYTNVGDKRKRAAVEQLKRALAEEA